MTTEPNGAGRELMPSEKRWGRDGIVARRAIIESPQIDDTRVGRSVLATAHDMEIGEPLDVGVALMATHPEVCDEVERIHDLDVSLPLDELVRPSVVGERPQRLDAMVAIAPPDLEAFAAATTPEALADAEARERRAVAIARSWLQRVLPGAADEDERDTVPDPDQEADRG